MKTHDVVRPRGSDAPSTLCGMTGRLTRRGILSSQGRLYVAAGVEAPTCLHCLEQLGAPIQRFGNPAPLGWLSRPPSLRHRDPDVVNVASMRPTQRPSRSHLEDMSLGRFDTWSTQ